MMSVIKRSLLLLFLTSLFFSSTIFEQVSATSAEKVVSADDSGAAADDEQKLEIEVLHAVAPEECTQKTRKGDKLSIHYTGTLFSTGETFDSSLEAGEPIQFALGRGEVIKGWDQGLMGMCIGEKRKLIVPPNLAYGEEGVGDKIPGDSTLVFRVELLDIIKEPPVAGRKPKRPDHELLQVEVLKTVSKRKCTVITYPGDFISIKYTGWNKETNEIIDQSPPDQAFEFSFGTGKVIQGWDKGLMGMCIGEKRKLIIDSELGYRDREASNGRNVIPPNTDLIYEIELVDINNSKDEL